MTAEKTDPAADINSSIERGESVPGFWERAHKSDSQLWLTGSTPVEVWTRLTVLHLLKPGAKVLNIGVGLGHCTRGLRNLGTEVSVLDISPAAIARVSDVASRSYLASDLESLPWARFDVALSHLVAQHMTNADLELQLKYVVRGLKHNGVFAIQYAQTFDGSHTSNETESGVRGGGVLRSPAHFADMVARAGGAVIWDQIREDWGAPWRVAHITHA